MAISSKTGPVRWGDNTPMPGSTERASTGPASRGPLSIRSSSIEVVNLSVPTEVRAFPLGRLEMFEVGGTELGRAVYAPGWVWSQHVAPLAGTPLCEVEHLGFVLSGRAAVKMADGTEVVLGPGDFFNIPPGHDSWVVGDEEYVSLHLAGAREYARSSPEDHGRTAAEGRNGL
jgi:quercetin dioxygenase-like cupin family protein